MVREKTALEKSETSQMEANRLRGALFAISLLEDITEIKRIASAAMRGELHGHEPSKTLDIIEIERQSNRAWHEGEMG